MLVSEFTVNAFGMYMYQAMKTQYGLCHVAEAYLRVLEVIAAD